MNRTSHTSTHTSASRRRPAAKGASSLLLAGLMATLFAGCGGEMTDPAAPPTTGEGDPGTNPDPMPMDPVEEDSPVMLDPSTRLLDFQAVPIGSSRDLQVNIVNVGADDVVFEEGDITAAPGNDSAFTFTYGTGRVVRGNGKLLFVTFTPTEERPYYGQLRVAPQGSDPVTIDLTGGGVETALGIDMERVDLGNVLEGTTVNQLVSVTNRTWDDAQPRLELGDNVELCPSADAPFCVSLGSRTLYDDGTFNLGSGSTAEIEVRYTAGEGTVRTEFGFFTLQYSDEREARRVQLTARRVVENVHCEGPGLLETSVGNCVQGEILCVAHANSSATIMGWGPNRDSHPDLSFASSSRLTLAEGESVGIEVEFCPSSTGVKDAWFDIDPLESLDRIQLRIRGLAR